MNSTSASDHYESEHQRGLAVDSAAAELADDLACAIASVNPRQPVRTPNWQRYPFTPASEVLHSELELHHLALAELLRDAAAGQRVQARARALIETACAAHGMNHAETLAEGVIA